MKTFTVEIQRVYTMHLMVEYDAKSGGNARVMAQADLDCGAFDQDFGEMFCDAEPSDSIVEIFETEK